MQCPLDGAVLAISERRGIEIDYCPQCRGVWLDRGELDKLLERAAEEFPEPPRPRDDRPEAPYRESRDYPDPRHEQRHDSRPDPRYDPHYRKKKKKSFLSEFLEFD